MGQQGIKTPLVLDGLDWQVVLLGVFTCNVFTCGRGEEREGQGQEGAHGGKQIITAGASP